VLLLLAAIIAAYFIGAIPFGYLVAKAARGIDIRQHGSGNIGATNVGRVLGLKWFFVVFLLDFLKAAIPVFLVARGLIPQIIPEGWPAAAAAAAIGLTILLGNMFPIYIGFKGGKGAATGTGVILPLALLPTVMALAAFIICFLATRYVSLSSIVAVISLVAAQLLLPGIDPFSVETAPVTWLCMIGALLVIYRHRTNIMRLLRGTELKVGKRSASSSSTN
jgi:glycerol-3-phosphate acyltransferase PlsY